MADHPQTKAPAIVRRTVLFGAIAAALALGCHGPRTTASGQTTLSSVEAPFATPVVAGTADVAALVAKVSPGVVSITATQELRIPGGSDPFEFFFGKRPGRRLGRDEIVKRRGLGSGFILDSAGHVVTNAHVIADARTVRVTLSDERELDAVVKGRDERLDLAVLELKGATDLPRLALGSSEQLRVGEYVVAIGNPFGLGHTVTMGIVSAKGRALGAGPYDDFIQTDASINPGNSGGPLFNLKGEVVGISTAINPAGQGIGFAIPIDALKDILPQLLEKGSVSRGRLGVSIQTVDATLAKALGMDKPAGALIGEVTAGSAAEKAGLKSGDVVVRADQSVVTHAIDLSRLIARRAPGTRVTLEVLGSGGKKRSVEVTLDELIDDGKHGGPRKWGAPAPGAPDFGIELGDDADEGVVVRDVDPGSKAADALTPGDVILEVNGTPVTKARDATARLRATSADRPVLLKVLRNGRPLYVAIERK